MENILIIVLAAIGAGVLAFVIAFVYVGCRLLSGKMTSKYLDKMMQQEKERKAKKRKPSGSAH